MYLLWQGAVVGERDPMTHKYLVGYTGNPIVYGVDASQGLRYTFPMTLKKALYRRKWLKTPKSRVRLYKLVVVREWRNGAKRG